MATESITVEVSSPAQRLAVELALAMSVELERVAAAAPAGMVLDACADAALVRGRDMIRETLQQVVQRQADDVSKKSGRPGHAPAAADAG